MSADVDRVRRSMKRQVAELVLLARRPVVDRVLELPDRRHALVDAPSDARTLKDFEHRPYRVAVRTPVRPVLNAVDPLPSHRRHSYRDATAVWVCSGFEILRHIQTR